MTTHHDDDRVLHLGDPARTATLLTEAAREEGLTWRVLQLARPGTGPLPAVLDRAVRGALWETRLLAERVRARRVHLHSALALPHVSWALGDYALHLHGTDIRTRVYEDRHRETVLRAVDRARVVFYSTPDLAEHVGGLRDDALLVPVPVPMGRPDPTELPTRGDYVFFPSRWEDVKGGRTQIEAAVELRRALPADIALVGLDWGPLADEARDAGVELLPKMPNPQFRAMVAGARLCIGQTAGIMSASELESLALDTPIVVPLNPEWYDGSHASLVDPPVLGGTALPARGHDVAALAAAAVTGQIAAPTGTRTWVERHHSPRAALREVLQGYRKAGW